MSNNQSDRSFATLLARHHRQLHTLAQAWQDLGARSVSIWLDDRQLRIWPETERFAEPFMAWPFWLDDQHGFELRVAGMADPQAQSRLQADAELLTALLRADVTQQQMTARLVLQQDQLLAVYRLAQTLRGHASVDEILRMLASEARELLQVESTFVVLLPHNSPPLLVQYPDALRDDTLLWGIFWETHASERSLVLPGETPIPLPDDIRNVLVTPFQLSHNVSGALGLINGPNPEFESSDVKLIQAVVDQAATHIENVLMSQEMYKQAQLQAEMQLARAVQSNLLSQQTPVVEGLDIYAATRPALQVGGDFYTLVYRVGRPFVFSVGDVSGKGLSAALLMTMARTSIHSKASYMPDPTPEIIMRQSNEDLYDDFARLGTFATVLVGTYRPERREVVYANAGHAPVIYRPRDGVATLLRADSTPMGIQQDAHAKNQTLILQRGDLLLIGTDGLSDALNIVGENFGSERLLNLIDQLAGLSAVQIAESLLTAVREFEGGGPAADDQTLVVLKGA